jgi:hypothetical protein
MRVGRCAPRYADFTTIILPSFPPSQKKKHRRVTGFTLAILTQHRDLFQGPLGGKRLPSTQRLNDRREIVPGLAACAQIGPPPGRLFSASRSSAKMSCAQRRASRARRRAARGRAGGGQGCACAMRLRYSVRLGPTYPATHSSAGCKQDGGPGGDKVWRRVAVDCFGDPPSPRAGAPPRPRRRPWKWRSSRCTPAPR